MDYINFRRDDIMTTSVSASTDTTTRTASRHLLDPSYQAFFLLRTVFTVAPILFGLDKFTNVLVQWDTYLAPWINDIVPGTGVEAMYAVGVVEILAGLCVAIAPRFGAWLIVAWLGGIIVNLLTFSGYYDVALRDFGLLVAAVALARLAQTHR